MISDEGKAQGDDSEDSPPAELKDIAALAVLLHGKQPAVGERPDEAEIWAWMHNELSEKRSSEVQSHVARDPSVYSLWHGLRAASQESLSEQSGVMSAVTHPVDSPLSNKKSDHTLSTATKWLQKVSSFLRPSPFMGFATAASLGVVVVVAIQNDEPSQDFWQDWQVPKSQIMEKSFEDRMAFESVLAGMNTKMHELSLPTLAPDGTRLPTTTPECEQAQDDVPCTQARQALYSLGQLVTETRLVCLTSYPIPKEKQERLLDIVSQLVGQPEEKPFIGPMEQWLASDARDQQCAAVNTIIDRALRGLSN